MTPWLAMALNNAWANATLYRAILGLTAAEFAAPRPGFFPFLMATLNHIHADDLDYLNALESGGLGLSVLDRDLIADPGALGEAQSVVDTRLPVFCRDLSDEGLSETRQTDRRKETVDERVDALLLHLFQHEVHHRGQAHVQVKDAGIPPPQLDEFFLDYDRAPSARAYFG